MTVCHAFAGLFKDRCDTTVALADWASARFYADRSRQTRQVAQHVTDAVRPALELLA
jgi:glutamyl-tRNA synthetase